MQRRIALLLMLLFTACTQGDPVRGLITDIEVRDGRTAAITVDSTDGSTRILTPGNIDYGFDLEHLQEHRDQALPVDVRVQERDGQRVALSIEDG